MRREIEGKSPIIPDSVTIADNAAIIGDVTIGEHSSVWFQAVIRADINSISIGEYTNIQDMVVIHTPPTVKVTIGGHVTVGHKALIHGCKIGNNCLIGMGAIIMNGVEIGDNCIVGAGSLITEGTKVPTGSLIFGSPAKVKRQLTNDEISKIKDSAVNYYEYSKKYRPK